MHRYLCLLFAVVTLMTSLWAEKKSFVREYTYQASEVDSKISARTIALEQVQRALLEECGVYLESNTEVVNYQLTKDEIKVMTAGTVETKILDEKWDGVNYWLNAEMIVDPDDVVKSIEALRDNTDTLQKMTELQRQNDDAMKQIEDLKKKLDAGEHTDPKQKEKDKTEYTALVNTFQKTSLNKELSLLMASRKFNEAYKKADEMLAHDPANIDALFIRGTAFVELGKYEQAKDDFTTIKKLSKDDKVTLSLVNLGYGTIMMKENDFPKALTLFNEALTQNPKMVFILFNRAEVLYKLGKYQDAMSDIEAFVRVKRKSANGFYLRGLIAEKNRMMLKARQSMEQAAKLGHPDAKKWLKENKNIEKLKTPKRP